MTEVRWKEDTARSLRFDQHPYDKHYTQAMGATTTRNMVSQARKTAPNKLRRPVAHAPCIRSDRAAAGCSTLIGCGRFRAMLRPRIPRRCFVGVLGRERGNERTSSVALRLLVALAVDRLLYGGDGRRDQPGKSGRSGTKPNHRPASPVRRARSLFPRVPGCRGIEPTRTALREDCMGK